MKRVIISPAKGLDRSMGNKGWYRSMGNKVML